jgi:hypothetical protein
MKDRLLDTMLAALTTATYYFVQLGLESRGVARTWRIPAAGILSAVIVGVALRYILTKAWWGLRPLRRWLVDEAALEGLWLEVLDRRGEQHYSIAEVKYDPRSQVSRFSMHGWSYFPDGREHSNWHTRYLRINQTSGGFNVDYIYEVENEKKRGYGESSYKYLGGGRTVAEGEGYYLAAEENPLSRCPYNLVPIDQRLKIQLGAEGENLATPDSRQRFIRLAHRRFGAQASAAAQDQ